MARPGWLFFHIPLREYVTAYAGYSETPKKHEGEGTKGDPFGYGYMNNGSYRVMQDSGIIGAFTGHDHRNDFSIDYFDAANHMVLSYGLKDSDLNYHDPDKIGYKIITLPSNPSAFTHAAIKEVKKAY